MNLLDSSNMEWWFNKKRYKRQAKKKNRSWDPGGISLLKVETANAHTQIEIAKVVLNVATTKVEQNDGKK